jgi:type II secretory pathway pseudopilin PulG
MPARTTKLLIVLLIVAIPTLAAATTYCLSQRDAAISSAQDLRAIRQQLRDLMLAGSAPTSASTGEASIADLSGRISNAANESQVSSQLAGIDPGRSSHLENSDYNETLVVVRFQPLSLKQLAQFLDALHSDDPRARPRTIELATPAEPTSAEAWSCNLTLSYLSYAPIKENSTP